MLTKDDEVMVNHYTLYVS